VIVTFDAFCVGTRYSRTHNFSGLL